MKDYRCDVLTELKSSLSEIDLAQTEQFVQEICSAKKIFCDGLGRSGLAMRGFAMRMEQMGLRSILVGEATAPAFEEGDLLIICSGSGASPTLLYHAKKAKAYGGKVLLITGRQESELAKLADKVLLIGAPDKDVAGQEKGSIQPMATLFEQTSNLICDIISLNLMDELKISSEEMRKYHANIE